MKSWLFERINKNEKPLFRLAREKKSEASESEMRGYTINEAKEMKTKKAWGNLNPNCLKKCNICKVQ